MTLEQIRGLVAGELAAVDEVIRSRLGSTVPLVSQVAEHIVAGGGKRLRPLIVLLAGFGANLLLTLAIVVVSPATLEEHIEGLETLAFGLTDDTPVAAMLLLLLLVGFYEEVVARGLLLTRARELVGGFWAGTGAAAQPEYVQGAALLHRRRPAPPSRSTCAT